jgi:hypothetical protein
MRKRTAIRGAMFEVHEGLEKLRQSSWTAAALRRFPGNCEKRRRAGALQDAGAMQSFPCGSWSHCLRRAKLGSP